VAPKKRSPLAVRTTVSKPRERGKTPSWARGNRCTNPVDGSEMVLIPGGPFLMTDIVGDDVEVDVPAFYMSKYEITNKQFQKFIRANPQWGKERVSTELADDSYYLDDWKESFYPQGQDDYPASWVSWFAAKAYCEWAGGRLPTEAEWEKACRAGTQTKYYWGDEDEQMDAYGWYQKNCKNGPKTAHAVGQKKPNAFGLFDMHGNASEWCSTIAKDSPYREDDGREDLTDTTANRVHRGGDWWAYTPMHCRSGYQNDDDPTYGNRMGIRLCVPAAR
jgi:formylglycine-generating enzyme required for sulfatase activity